MKKFKKILVAAICASMVIQSVPAQAQEAAVKIVETGRVSEVFGKFREIF